MVAVSLQLGQTGKLDNVLCFGSMLRYSEKDEAKKVIYKKGGI
jgi:hypothetical protein